MQLGQKKVFPIVKQLIFVLAVKVRVRQVVFIVRVSYQEMNVSSQCVSVSMVL